MTTNEEPRTFLDDWHTEYLKKLDNGLTLLEELTHLEDLKTQEFDEWADIKGEPKTPEQWLGWFYDKEKQSIGFGTENMIETIRSAQEQAFEAGQEQAFERGYMEGCLKIIESCEQARRLAIEECAQIFEYEDCIKHEEAGICIVPRIRALLEKK